MITGNRPDVTHARERASAIGTVAAFTGTVISLVYIHLILLLAIVSARVNNSNKQYIYSTRNKLISTIIRTANYHTI